MTIGSVSLIPASEETIRKNFFNETETASIENLITPTQIRQSTETMCSSKHERSSSCCFAVIRKLFRRIRNAFLFIPLLIRQSNKSKDTKVLTENYKDFACILKDFSIEGIKEKLIPIESFKDHFECFVDSNKELFKSYHNGGCRRGACNDSEKKLLENLMPLLPTGKITDLTYYLADVAYELEFDVTCRLHNRKEENSYTKEKRAIKLACETVSLSYRKFGMQFTVFEKKGDYDIPSTARYLCEFLDSYNALLDVISKCKNIFEAQKPDYCTQNFEDRESFEVEKNSNTSFEWEEEFDPTYAEEIQEIDPKTQIELELKLEVGLHLLNFRNNWVKEIESKKPSDIVAA